MNLDPCKETRFKKGVSGNPNGRPEGSFSLVTILKNKLQEVPKGKERKTYAEILIEKMLSKATKGDVTMIKDAINRIDGMPPQTIEHEGEFKVDVSVDKMINKVYDESS